MHNFDFLNPTKLIFGKDTIGRIGEEIKSGGARKVLLIAGGGSIKKNGVYDQTVASLKDIGIEWVETWGVKPNPVLSKVREMIDLAKKEKVDAILAVGGGSVIDSGKAVATGMCIDDVWQAFEARDQLVEKAMPVYSVLTISATGTEMDQYAVLTNEEENKKWNIAGPALYPKVSIVDPSVQTTLPWDQTVNGALDAMSHIMEYYFIGGRSETTLALDESLFRTIVQMTDELKSKPDDYESRANLAWAATLALNGTSGAGQGGGDWASHGIEHGISALNPEVAHGAGLGVVFPAWITYCQDANPALFKRWAKNIWDAESVEDGVSAMKAKLKEWGAPTTLAELGVKRPQIRDIAVNTVEFGLTGAVKQLTEDDIVNLLSLASPE
jgi:alcohol dehydrogenase YqhD (iron-dependent ADH family)